MLLWVLYTISVKYLLHDVGMLLWVLYTITITSVKSAVPSGIFFAEKFWSFVP